VDDRGLLGGDGAEGVGQVLAAQLVRLGMDVSLGELSTWALRKSLVRRIGCGQDHRPQRTTAIRCVADDL
jgi:hypothetical protein